MERTWENCQLGVLIRTKFLLGKKGRKGCGMREKPCRRVAGDVETVGAFWRSSDLEQEGWCLGVYSLHVHGKGEMTGH